MVWRNSGQEEFFGALFLTSKCNDFKGFSSGHHGHSLENQFFDRYPTMMKRPWPITALALMHVFAPIPNIWFSSTMMDLNILEYVLELFRSDSWMDILAMMVFFPVAGGAIYACKRWSYPVFVIVLVWSLFINYTTWIEHSTIYSLPLLLLVYAMNLSLVGYFLIPTVKATYFDPSNRWWESASRYQVNWVGEIRFGDQDPANCTIYDISTGGLFVLWSGHIEVGTDAVVKFSYGNVHLALHGRVVHRGGGDLPGIGIQYMETDFEMRDRLRRVIAALDLLDMERKPRFSDWKSVWIYRLNRVFGPQRGLGKVNEPLAEREDVLAAKKESESDSHDQAA